MALMCHPHPLAPQGQEGGRAEGGNMKEKKTKHPTPTGHVPGKEARDLFQEEGVITRQLIESGSKRGRPSLWVKRT